MKSIIKNSVLLKVAWHNIALSSLLSLAILLITVQVSSAQPGTKPLKASTTACGHDHFTAKDMTQYRRLIQNEPKQFGLRFRKSSVREVPVMFHIVQNNDGDGVTPEQVAEALDRANEKYAPANIQFYQCSDPNIIVSDSWYDTQFQFEWENNCGANTPEYDLDAAYHVPNVVNIYCVRTNGWSWASYPWYKEDKCWDWVVFHHGHIDTEWLLAHELGHYLGLRHTFGNDDENVTRNPADPCYNCETAGDLICDTPADHHRSADWQPGCEPDDMYDDCGVLLQPEGLNIMSYSNGDCEGADKFFTDGQMSRMNHFLTTERDYLFCGHSCKASRNFTGTHTISKTHNYYDYITSTADVNAGSNVTYKAGNYIILKAGFVAKDGASFLATINGCIDTDNIGSQQDPMPSTVEVSTTIELNTEKSGGQVNYTGELSLQLSPNPVEESTIIQFELIEASMVSLKVFNLDGKVVANLKDGQNLEAGFHQLTYTPNELPIGMYFAQMITEHGSKTVPFIIK